MAQLSFTRLSLLTHDVGDTVGGELLARRAEGSWAVDIARRIITNGSIYIEQAHLTDGQQLGLALSADERFLFVAQSHTDDVLQVEIRQDGSAGDRQVYAAGLERVPDGLAFDVAGNLYVSCYASDNIYQVSPERDVKLLAYDRAGTTLARPTNIAFGGLEGDELYVANLGRWHINHAKLGIKGQLLANQRK